MTEERRDTTTITTPIGNHVVVLKAYLTGRDRRALRNIWIAENSEIEYNTQSGDVKNIIKRDIMKEAEELAWKIVIVSIDGHTDGEEVDGKPFSIIETLLDMHEDDFSVIDKAVGTSASEKKIAK